MHQTKEQLYELVKDLQTKSEFDKAIKEKSQEYDELLDENTIALLLVDELGRNKHVITKIVDIKPDTECTVAGTITKIHQPKTFTRKNGSSGQVINLDIRDETGTCRLVVWNDDVKQVKDLNEGTTVKIVNGYTKNGFSGIEVNLGRWGLLEVEPNEQHDLGDRKLEKEPQGITGTLTNKEPTRAFFKDNGEFGFVTTITIKAKNGEKQLTVWGEKVKEIQQFKIGDTIKITKTLSKHSNGKTELHINDKSTIQRC